MKRSSIGSAGINVSLPFWSGGKSASALRQNERELYSQIDLLQERADYMDDPNELYNQMDLIYSAICLIDKFGYDNTLLFYAGIVMNNHLSAYNSEYADIESRNQHVNGIITSMITEVNSLTQCEEVTTDFTLWWKNTILDQNYFIDFATGAQTDVSPESAALGASEYDEYCAKLKEGGGYFCYAVCNSDLLTSKQSFAKSVGQNNVIDALEGANPAFSRNVSINLINSGIVNTTKGGTANTMVESFRNGTASVGDPFSIIVGLVIAVISLVTAILAVVQAEKEKKTAQILSEANIQANAPDTSDWQYADTDGDGKADARYNPTTGELEPLSGLKIPNWLIIAGGAIGLYLIL